jgi:ankyrin repeat protein
LIDAGAEVDAVSVSGMNACHYAWNNPAALSLLIAAGVDPTIEDGAGETPLHIAAKHEDSVESLLVLFNAGVDVNQGNYRGDCAGHFAARSGCVENLKFLLEEGARINRRNRAGETMLFVAATAKQVAVVDMLVNAGAAINVRTDHRVSPLDAGLRGCIEIARRLVRAGASLHDVGANGWSVCHVAARSPVHAVESLRFVIEGGADVHAIDDYGASVAHGANASAFPLLRSLGVDLNGANDSGDTPSHTAIDGAALMALFALGATMTSENDAGLTPFEARLRNQVGANDDALLTFVAAGVGVGVQTELQDGFTSAIVIAGGGLVSPHADAAALLAHEGVALNRIVARQIQLFRLRALEVLHWLAVTACERAGDV